MPINWDECTERPRQRILYNTPFRVHSKYTLAQTFTLHIFNVDSNLQDLRSKIMFVNVFYVSRPLLCRLRLADGDDTTMSGEDMRQAAHQLRCKDTEFL